MKVVAYGGGTNSTAMLIWMHENGVRPDLILFADTGAEKPHTYEHIKVVNTWLERIGFPSIVFTRKAGRIYVGETLEHDCLRRKVLPSIAYGFKSCSQKYKVQPQSMYCNNNSECKAVWDSGKLVEQYIGYDADEERRAKFTENEKYKFQYPLIGAGWGREECVQAIDRAGLQQPGKSACFFCPSSKKAEILKLRDQYPELMERALAMEAQAELTSVKGLGRSFSWRELLAINDGQPDLFSDAGKEMECGCYDGD